MGEVYRAHDSPQVHDGFKDVNTGGLDSIK
jgi:hypothetical protein